jgi:exosortase
MAEGAPSPRLVHWALLLLPLPILFRPTLGALWHIWWQNPNYSHGFLIPVVSAVMLWQRRVRLRALRAQPSVWGLALVGLGLALHLAGLRAEVTLAQGYGLLLVLAGIVLHLGGWPWLRVLAFPLAFLVFMLPGPPLLMNQVSFALKAVASRASGLLLEALGIPVAREGAILYLPAGPLAVENPCSGLRSLLALLALGALMARSGSVPLWKRLALFAAAWPVAVLANVVRITALGLVATTASLELAVGKAHDVSGYVLFLIALGMLELVRRALRW